ncbi:MAG: CRISPR system precrRNA processing endoribonuclease RAMP protein Cas6 [Gemmatimonadota bacterium]
MPAPSCADLLSTVLVLRALDSGTLPSTSGYLCYSAILNLLRAEDAGLAEELKSDKTSRGLTVSGLFGDLPSRGARVTVRKGALFGVRVTSLMGELTSVFRGWATHLPQTVWLGPRSDPVRFEICQVIDSSQGHPLVRIGSYTQLVEEAEDSSSAVSWTIHLDSPATFEAGGGHLPLPIPHLIFGGLWRRWRTHATPELMDPCANGLRTLLAAVGERGFRRTGRRPSLRSLDLAVRVAAFDLHSRMLDFGPSGGKRVGFQGRAAFALPRRYRSPEASRALSILTRFSYYAGVGAHTAVGMGQVGAVTVQQSSSR